MNKLFGTLAALGALCAPLPALSQPEVMPYSTAALGCMKLGECTEDIQQIRFIEQIEEIYQSSFDVVAQEASTLLALLEKNDVSVYLADERYFPRGHRGLYYTDNNNMYLNQRYMGAPAVFLELLRHEGWHAAQDCMAGGLNNTFIAVIHNPEIVPQEFKLDADIRYGMYQPESIPWEQEALWAGDVENMTVNALMVCGSDINMWDAYEPTPKTREWLIKTGHLDD